MKMTGAQAIVKALELEGVRVMFGYPGAAICPFYDAIIGSGVEHILVRHEQGAVHAASGYARVTGSTGVCVATSGPGATNTITGIATAYMDSIPIVAITGQVSSELIGRDVFQEADITGATTPFCKHNYLVKKAQDLPRIMKEAFHIAGTGRPGPVLVDIPIDIQNDELRFDYPDSVDIKGYKPTYKGHSMQIRKVAEAVGKARAPVICAGGGIISSHASAELVRFAETCGIPVTTTLMGIGSIPADHRLCYGMIGSHGVYAANKALHNADLVIIMGARVGDRSMGKASQIAGKARIIHIDIDPAEIGKNIDVDIPVVGDVKLILNDLLDLVKPGDTGSWIDTLEKAKQDHSRNPHPANTNTNSNTNPDADAHADDKAIHPAVLLKKLSEAAGDDALFTTEVGQNQIWAANHLVIRKPGSFITSGGLGTMGYGLPAAVGAATGRPGAKVIAVSGDGSFQMSLQELGTIKQQRLGIKMVILNNSRLGMVHEVQKDKYCRRYSQTYLEHNPDFVKLVGAYGFAGEKISSAGEIGDAVKRLLSGDRPYLLECVINPEEPTL